MRGIEFFKREETAFVEHTTIVTGKYIIAKEYSVPSRELRHKNIREGDVKQYLTEAITRQALSDVFETTWALKPHINDYSKELIIQALNMMNTMYRPSEKSFKDRDQSYRDYHTRNELIYMLRSDPRHKI